MKQVPAPEPKYRRCCWTPSLRESSWNQTASGISYFGLPGTVFWDTSGSCIAYMSSGHGPAPVFSGCFGIWDLVSHRVFRCKFKINHLSEVQIASCAQMGGHLLEDAKGFLTFVRTFFSWICFETHLFLVEFIFLLTSAC